MDVVRSERKIGPNGVFALPTTHFKAESFIYNFAHYIAWSSYVTFRWNQFHGL